MPNFPSMTPAIALMVALLCASPARGLDAELAAPPTATAASSVRLLAQWYTDEARLGHWLLDKSPELLDLKGAVLVTAAEITRARQIPNPGVDLTWATIPLGATTPPGLASPLSQIPSYGLMLRQPLEPGKRGPRVAFAEAATDLARAQIAERAVARFFDLQLVLAGVARQQQRLAVQADLLQSSQQLLDLHRARSGKGDVAGLEVTRLELEHNRLEADRAATEQDLADSLATCAAIAAAPCEAFADREAAQRWYAQQVAVALPSVWTPAIEARRPDLLTLAAVRRAASAQVAVGRSQRLPDLEARLGYLFDQFTLSGNQQQSLTLGIGLSLPVFARGEADLRAASALLARADAVATAQIAAAQAQLLTALRRRTLAEDRAKRLDVVVDRAQKVLAALSEGLRRGAATMTDVLLARRSWQEVVLQRQEVDADVLAATLDARRAAALAPEVLLRSGGGAW